MQIKELRKLAGIKQGTLAKDMGVSQPTVSDWESGKINPTMDNLVFLAEYFSVTVGCIIGTEPIPDGYPDNYTLPVFYSDLKEKQKKATEEGRVKKIKSPLTKEQISYIDDMIKANNAELIDELMDRLDRDSSSSNETDQKAEGQQAK